MFVSSNCGIIWNSVFEHPRLFERKHLGEDGVMAQGLFAGSQDGQHLCSGAHQQLRDRTDRDRPPGVKVRTTFKAQRDV